MDYPEHRSFVGNPASFDLLGGGNFMLFLLLGLRQHHRFLDIGCGSLRSGRFMIMYLEPNRYFGIDPNDWLIDAAAEEETGRDLFRIKCPRFALQDNFDFKVFQSEFDYVHAHSVLTHVDRLGLADLVASLSQVLTDEGLAIVTFLEGEHDNDNTGWTYPGLVTYRWDTVQAVSKQHGLVVQRLVYPHDRQSYLVLSRNASSVRNKIDTSPWRHLLRLEIE